MFYAFIGAGAIVKQLVQGYPIYTEAGFRNAFLLSAAVGLIGALVALAIPHRRRRSRTARETPAPLVEAAAR